MRSSANGLFENSGAADLRERHTYGSEEVVGATVRDPIEMRSVRRVSNGKRPDSQRPINFGVRFSRNAATPSALSWVMCSCGCTRLSISR